MKYMFKSFLLALAFLPLVLLVTLLILVVTEPASVAAMYGVFLSVLLSTGFVLGRRHARKSDLPGSFAPRYWPLLAPMVLLLAARIVFSDIVKDAPLFYYNAWTAALVLCYAPLIVSFAACVPPDKKLVSRKWRWQTCAFIVSLFAILAWQAKQDHDNTLRTYGGVTVSDEAIVHWYWPWVENNRLAKLGAPASFLISDNYPVVDGATSFVPIYSAVVNEIYQVSDKNELLKYMTCSRTAGAYDRLIRGKADLIFVLQPSDGHLEAAKDAGVELQLTPIAKEAFVFFVDRRNPVSNLSLEQIQDIYLKKITNWRQVGGDDKKILPFQRPENSGSQTAMLKEVMRGKKLPPPLQSEYLSSMGDMVRGVATFRDQEESIGYSFRFYAQVMVRHGPPGDRAFRFQVASDAEPVKLLSVNGVAPTAENIRNGSYPFTQDVFAATAGTTNPHVPKLIEWLLSPQGQELIEKTGYIGVAVD